MLTFKQYLEEAIIHSSFSGKKSPDVKNLARMSHKFVYHSGVSSDIDHMKHELEPRHGDWIRDVVHGATEMDADEILDRATPLVWMSDHPDWVRSKVARKIKKHVSNVTDDDVREHGHVALIPKKGDHAEHIWHVGEDSLNNGPHTILKNLNGEERNAHSTGLYDDGKEPVGVEKNEYVSAHPVEPMVHLTGQHLVDFLKHVEAKSKK